ncbi:hypothetical protein F2Q70_00027540 [Brassica cretica]|uniref:Uncharacterized protein n=1 Tax=Brassica cretica TaxID=69181 RepID=A0A8S9IAZ8_BRACR|nr:hypothetical protein F2Q68_00027102 [Brassica cretica]KAF2602140.1 hypothetical protein F2Q70_00027540 [Brassica cretica]
MELVEELKVEDWVRVKASAFSMSYGWEDITLNSNDMMHNLDADALNEYKTWKMYI